MIRDEAACNAGDLLVIVPLGMMGRRSAHDVELVEYRADGAELDRVEQFTGPVGIRTVEHDADMVTADAGYELACSAPAPAAPIGPHTVATDAAAIGAVTVCAVVLYRIRGRIRRR